jgi:hypothetical protein
LKILSGTCKFSTQQQHLKASHWILVVISISYFFFSLVTAHEFLTLPRLSIYPDESTQHSATIHLSSLFTTLWGHKNEVYMFTAGSKAEKMTEQSWRLLPQCLSGLGIILILLLSHKFWIARAISCTRHSRRVPESTNLQVSTTRWTMENEKFAACGRKFNLFANLPSKKKKVICKQLK